MAVSASIEAIPSAPAHGDDIVAAYTVTGNDAVAAQSATISGRVVVGGVTFDVSTTITMPGTPAQPVTFEAPTGAGLDFTVSSTDPSKFTAHVP